MQSRIATLALLLSAAPALADKDTFHGFSKDGSWLVYETKGFNDTVEFFFCASDQTGNPTWPAALNEMDRSDERTLSCIRFTDPNRLPLDWRKALILPEPSLQSGGVRVLPELVAEGEAPGFQLEAGGKKQLCFAASIRDDSHLVGAWWHPTGKWVAVVIDGGLRVCAVSLKGAGGKAKKK